MAELDRSDAHRAREYLDLAEEGETSGSTDQGEGGPTASDDPHDPSEDAARSEPAAADLEDGGS